MCASRMSLPDNVPHASSLLVTACLCAEPLRCPALACACSDFAGLHRAHHLATLNGPHSKPYAAAVCVQGALNARHGLHAWPYARSGHSNGVLSVCMALRLRRSLKCGVVCVHGPALAQVTQTWFGLCAWPCACAGHSNVVWSVCMAHDGQEAVSVSHDETIRFWDTMKVHKRTLVRAPQPYPVCSPACKHGIPSCAA